MRGVHHNMLWRNTAVNISNISTSICIEFSKKAADSMEKLAIDLLKCIHCNYNEAITQLVARLSPSRTQKHYVYR